MAKANNVQILTADVLYNCKIKGTGLVGYYVRLSVVDTAAKWSGYVDNETLLWLAERGEQAGVHLCRDNAADAFLIEVKGEWKLPFEKEDAVSYDMDAAFIKGKLNDIRRERKRPVHEVLTEQGAVMLPLKIKEYHTDTKLSAKVQVVQESKAPITEEIKTWGDGTSLHTPLLKYLYDKILEHNFEFNDLVLRGMDREYKLFGRVLLVSESNPLRVQFVKKQRMYVLSGETWAKKEGTRGFVCFLKGRRLLCGWQFNSCVPKYASTASLAFLQQERYASIQQRGNISVDFSKVCYVLMGVEATEQGSKVTDYFVDITDCQMQLAMSLCGSFCDIRRVVKAEK